MSKIVLSGYYGFNNAGDEAILYAVIRALREIRPDAKITVLSHKPSQTARQHQVLAVNRWSLFNMLKTLSSCDLLISGGGSLLQDVTGAKSPLYYLGVIFLAKLLGKKTVVYAQGIGPLKWAFNRKLTAWFLNRVNLITVRDQGSKEELGKIGVTAPITVTADPVLGLPPENVDPEEGRQIIARNGIEMPDGMRLLGVFIRPWKDSGYLPELVKACDKLVDEGWRVIFIPMHFPGDIAICKQAVRMMDREAFFLKEMYGPEEILAITKNLNLVVGMRLHALIIGALAGIPVVGLSYDPKVDSFLNQIGLQSLLTVQDLQAPTLLEIVNWAYDRREQVSTDMGDRVRALAEKARRTARLTADILEQ